MESFFADPNVYDDRGLRLGPYSFLKEGPEQTVVKHYTNTQIGYFRSMKQEKSF